MTTPFCAIDFGTSNSTVGVLKDGQPTLLTPESGHQAIPTALFFPFNSSKPHIGHAAVNAYLEGDEGRFMKGIKSVLGTALFSETTQIQTKSIGFETIIATYLSNLKTCAEESLGQPVTRAMIGRPVHFLTNEPAADPLAESQLKQAAQTAGFQDVTFMPEPLAAAWHFESTLPEDQLALIIDIGGGTADFSILQLGPNHRSQTDRTADILATHGLRLGGAMIDKALSLDHIMPLFGYGSPTINPGMTVPAWYYHTLTAWHRIHQLYERKALTEIRHTLQEAIEPHKLERLLTLIEERGGHHLSLAVEDTKIALSSQSAAICNLAWLEPNLTPTITQTQLTHSLEDWMSTLTENIHQTLTLANLKPEQLQTVFVTGGPSAMPLTRQTIAQTLPQAKPIYGDLLTSVGHGLILAAQRHFA